MGAGVKEKHNVVAVAWHCPEQLASLWPKNVLYHGAPLGQGGEIQAGLLLSSLLDPKGAEEALENAKPGVRK